MKESSNNKQNFIIKAENQEKIGQEFLRSLLEKKDRIKALNDLETDYDVIIKLENENKEFKVNYNFIDSFPFFKQRLKKQGNNNEINFSLEDNISSSVLRFMLY